MKYSVGLAGSFAAIVMASMALPAIALPLSSEVSDVHGAPNVIQKAHYDDDGYRERRFWWWRHHRDRDDRGGWWRHYRGRDRDDDRRYDRSERHGSRDRDDDRRWR